MKNKSNWSDSSVLALVLYFLWVIAYLLLVLNCTKAHAGSIDPIVMSSDWNHIGDDLAKSVVPNVVIFSDPTDSVSADLRLRVQETLRTSNNTQYVHVWEVPTTEPEPDSDAQPRMSAIPTILFVGHAPDNSLVLLNAALGEDDTGHAIDQSSLSDFFTEGWNRLWALTNGPTSTLAPRVVTVSAADLRADPQMFAGTRAIFLFGRSDNWLRQLQLQVFSALSTSLTDFTFVNVTDSDEPGCSRIEIRVPDPSRPGQTLMDQVQGFVTEEQLRHFIVAHN